MLIYKVPWRNKNFLLYTSKFNYDRKFIINDKDIIFTYFISRIQKSYEIVRHKLDKIKNYRSVPMGIVLLLFEHIQYLRNIIPRL